MSAPIHSRYLDTTDNMAACMKSMQAMYLRVIRCKQICKHAYLLSDSQETHLYRRNFHASSCLFKDEPDTDQESANDLDYFGIETLKSREGPTEAIDLAKSERLNVINPSKYGRKVPLSTTAPEEFLPFGVVRYDKRLPKDVVKERKAKNQEALDAIALRKKEKARKKEEKKAKKLSERVKNNHGIVNDSHTKRLVDSKNSERVGHQMLTNVTSEDMDDVNPSESNLSYLDDAYFGHRTEHISGKADREGKKEMGFIDEQYFDSDIDMHEAAYFNRRKTSVMTPPNTYPSNEKADAKQEYDVEDLSFFEQQLVNSETTLSTKERNSEIKVSSCKKDMGTVLQPEEDLSYIDEQYIDIEKTYGQETNSRQSVSNQKNHVVPEKIEITNQHIEDHFAFQTEPSTLDTLMTDIGTSLEKKSISKTQNSKTEESMLNKSKIETSNKKTSEVTKSKTQIKTEGKLDSCLTFEEKEKHMHLQTNRKKSVQSNLEELQSFKKTHSFPEIGNRKATKLKRKKTKIEDEDESAYSMAMQLRDEYERKNKHNVHGRANPKEYDSQGFRILTGQVPDFQNVPKMDVIKVLRQNILYNGNDIVAINKPYGLSLQRGTGEELSIDHFLSDVIPSTELHSVQTISRDITGVMLFGRTEEMKNKLEEKISQGEVISKYLTITKNVPKLFQGEIDIPIVEGTVQGKHRMALRPERTVELSPVMPKSKPGIDAVTRYRVLDARDNNYALVECIPLTSVKHQIRVHLAFGLNCPILGDHKYSHTDKLSPMVLHPNMLQRLKIQQSKVRHLALHLHCRSIVIPEFINGRNLFVSAPFPVHFLANMRDLKLKLPPNC